MLHQELPHRARARSDANQQSRLLKACGLLRQHLQFGLWLWHLRQSTGNQRHTHLYRCIRGLKLNWHTKLCDQHLGHHHDLLRLQASRPRHVVAWHLSPKFQYPLKLHRQDHQRRYSSFAGKDNFQRLYKRQRRSRALTLSLAHL